MTAAAPYSISLSTCLFMCDNLALSRNGRYRNESEPVGNRQRESPEVGSAALRMMRALVRRAGEGDTEALEWLAHLERELPALITEAGAAAHRFGYTYTTLAQCLGVTRQAARQRFITR